MVARAISATARLCAGSPAERDAGFGQLDDTRGRLFHWLKLPDELHVHELALQAKAFNVYFAAGEAFFVDPQDGRQHLRLSFSYLPLADLRLGIATLGRLIEQMTE